MMPNILMSLFLITNSHISDAMRETQIYAFLFFSSTSLLFFLLRIVIKSSEQWPGLSLIPTSEIRWLQANEMANPLCVCVCVCVCVCTQARILEWVAIPFSRGSSQPRDWTWITWVSGRFFPIWATTEVPYIYIYLNSLLLKFILLGGGW